MKISEGVEWGVHCALLLASLEPGATLPGRALAEYHGVSESYLAKHLQAMANAGIIESVSGPKGGYRLARAAEGITVLDIVDAIEGREPAFHCTEIRQRGPTAVEPSAYPLPCAIHADHASRRQSLACGATFANAHSFANAGTATRRPAQYGKRDDLAGGSRTAVISPTPRPPSPA